MSYRWVEDAFVMPDGVCRLDLPEPVTGKTYVMYHGTTSQAARSILAQGFRQSAGGMLGQGVYLSRDLEKASRYPINHPVYDKVVIKVLVDVGRVIAIRHQNHPHQKTWHDSGYDTAWVPPNCGMVPSGLEEDCVWDPNRIKVLKVIEPRFVQQESFGGWAGNAAGANVQWAEDDFSVPEGASRLDLPEPISGRTYVMYHGTTSQAARSILATGFKRSKDGMLGPGVYLSRDLKKASRYPIGHPEHDRVVIRVKVKVGKVIVINKQDHPRQMTWHDSDYGEVFDTAWVPPNCGMVKSGLEENCVWDPNRIQIMDTIKPLPVQPSSGRDAHGHE